MRSSTSSLFGSLASLISLGTVAVASVASAAVTEPDGTIIPQPLTEDISQGVVDCCGVAPDGSNMSLAALFQSRQEPIDWLADASTEPSYFSPLCGFRGTLVLRGGGCRITFGWYNVDLANPIPPLNTAVYPLVTVMDVNAWFTANNFPQNNENAFHPAVGEPPIPGALIANIRDDPRYLGGLIGLATLGDDIGQPPQCTQTHYSEPRLNQVSIWGDPWIMAVTYLSHVTPNAFYLAFEDLPTAADNFRLPTSRGYMNDGDFNDFVYFIEGITCEGGGQPCLTSAEGACGFGMTECQPDGTVICISQLQPGPELCDNLDNDCNGLVDDGELCPPGEVCDKGVCRPNCSGGEFPCESPLVCDSAGLCVDPACLNVICDVGQVCVGGACVGGCDNVICPHGQFCQLGRCVDPCINRLPGAPNACPDGTVCEGGVCMESCHCRVCGPGQECNYDTGACELIGCVNVPCPAGQRCDAGMCVDACAGVICPGGAICQAGWCGEPLGPVDPGTGGTGPGAGGTGGTILIGDSGVVTGSGGGTVAPPAMLCNDTCQFALTGACEDGGPTATAEYCAYGTDCSDCGQQLAIDALPIDNTCPTASNGICEDGVGLAPALCIKGTDHQDCGDRFDGTPTDPATLGGPVGSPPPDPEATCACRAVGGRQGSGALAALLLAALGLGGLRRRPRRR